MDCQIVS